MAYCIVLFQLSTFFKLFETQFLFSFRIHNCESVGSNDILHCDIWTLFKLLKALFLKLEFFTQFLNFFFTLEL
jgi:hypothetical protein